MQVKIRLKRIAPQINISKIFSFLSSLLFISGIFLLVSAGSDWISFNILKSLPAELFIEFRYLLNIYLFILLLIVLIFLFPSSISKKTSDAVQPSLQIERFSLFFLVSRIETILLLYLGVYLLTQLVDVSYIKYLVLGLIAIAVLQEVANKLYSFNLRVFSRFSASLGKAKPMFIFTSGFFSKFLLSPENSIALGLMVLIPEVKYALPAIVLFEIVHTFRILIRQQDLNSKAKYFSHYTISLTTILVALLLWMSM